MKHRRKLHSVGATTIKTTVGDGVTGQQNKPEPPAEPIKVADWLIDRHMEHAGEFERHFAAENAGKIVAGSPVEKFRQAQVAKIRQIAEHLLTYCNHAEVE